MKIKFIGQSTAQDIQQKVDEVIASTTERIKTDLEATVNGFELHDAEVTVKFNVEGMDEPQVMSVEHHEGIPEIFTWYVDAESGEEGSNEDESQFDAWTVAKSKGENLEFLEIESIYSVNDFTGQDEELTEHQGDMSKVVLNHVEGFKVVQVLQKGKLIQEYKLTPKEDSE